MDRFRQGAGQPTRAGARRNFFQEIPSGVHWEVSEIDLDREAKLRWAWLAPAPTPGFPPEKPVISQ
jgi:hypothetical protein